MIECQFPCFHNGASIDLYACIYICPLFSLGRCVQSHSDFHSFTCTQALMQAFICVYIWAYVVYSIVQNDFELNLVKLSQILSLVALKRLANFFSIRSKVEVTLSSNDLKKSLVCSLTPKVSYQTLNKIFIGSSKGSPQVTITFWVYDVKVKIMAGSNVLYTHFGAPTPEVYDQNSSHLYRFFLPQNPSIHSILRAWGQRSRSQQAQMTLENTFLLLYLQIIMVNQDLL